MTELDQLHDKIAAERIEENKLQKLHLRTYRALYDMFRHRKLTGKNTTSGSTLASGTSDDLHPCAECGKPVRIHDKLCRNCQVKTIPEKSKEFYRLQELRDLNTL